MTDEPKQRRWQFSLLTILLLVALVAVVVAFHRIHDKRELTERKVRVLQALACELTVDDPSKIVVIKRLPTLSDELIVGVYLPELKKPARINRLCLSLENILSYPNSRSVYPTPNNSFHLTPGEHWIELHCTKQGKGESSSQYVIEALVDGRGVMKEIRDSSWQPVDSCANYSTLKSVSQSFTAGQRIKLYHRRNYERTQSEAGFSVQNESNNGILLWIDEANSDL
ncbi:hypothetical protein CA13_72420 [Planctomycetes bacterium CA13]|uniref:Uncharacterized protein n=1 Tax=Novipirellula herctigrandis TaxID=2527986 RepID=A0A5C5YPB0_9BACT|nr:hypothetical protein CA13_72420 [Planctomycetes bacterium CA13]